jgi:hypothetical protein
VSEYNRTYAILRQNTAAFLEGLVDRFFEEGLILRSALVRVGSVPNTLTELGCKCVLRIKRITQEWVKWQGTLQPDEEEVR